MNPVHIRSRHRLPIAITLALATTSGAQAATITVDSNDDSAASTFCNLRDALTSINNGNTASTPTCASTVSGAFGSNDLIVFDDSLVNATITLTQGSLSVGWSRQVAITGSGQTIDAAGHAQVLSLSQYDTVTASNLTFTGGNAPNGGGGISVGRYSGLTLNNCTVSNNSGSLGGGILVESYTALTLNNSTVSGNTATSSGGGVYVDGGLTLNASTISNNTAAGSGGGVYVRGVFLTLNASTISNNVSYCSTNHACGGGIHLQRVDLIAIDSTVSGNSVSKVGHHLAGGVYMRGTYFGKFINSTITGNFVYGSDYLGGGLLQQGGGLTLINSTVVSNFAAGYAASTHTSGGMVTGVGFPGYTGKLTLANTIVANNLCNMPANHDVFIGAGTTTLSAQYNLFGSTLNRTPFNDVANHNIFSDTLGLGPLQSNGGGTQTMALQPGSLAIDAGNDALAVDESAQPLQTDQTGFVRIYNGTVDIGAFEYRPDEIFGDRFE